MKLLHLVAMSAIRIKGEVKQYYDRKIKEGNKIILRVFARKEKMPLLFRFLWG